MAQPATPAAAVPLRAFHDGDRVRHRAFGEGLVVSSRPAGEDVEVTVAFPDRGVKRLLASLAGLEPA
jgi:DNA helicase-2/ATP-dependent DNA helicase PcrA